MTSPTPRKHVLALRLLAGIAVAMLLTVGWIAIERLNSLAQADRWEDHSQQVLLSLEELFSALIDAESAQRGFVVTGDEQHLEIYRLAITATQQRLDAAQRLTADNSLQQQRFAALVGPLQAKLAGMERNVRLRRSLGFEAARESGRDLWSRGYMAQIRQQITAMQTEEQRLLAMRRAAKEGDIRRTIQSLVVGGAFGILTLLIVLTFLWRESARRRSSEAALAAQRDRLETLVAERTMHLAAVNAELLDEAAMHKKAMEALAASETRLRLAADSARIGMWEWWPGAGHALWSAREYELFGLPVGDGREPSSRFFAPVHPDDLAGLHDSLAGVLAHGGDWHHEFRVIHPDGSVHWLAGTGQAHCDETGKPERMLGVSYDISERKDWLRQLEQRVAERTRELTEANQELDAFSYAVAHNLRSPLRAMIGFSEALVEDYGARLDGPAHEYLAQIDEASRTMSALIDGVLQLTRSTRGELQSERIDLSALAADIRAGLERQAPARRVEWRIEAGLEAVGDRQAIEAALRSLLENAWKFSAGADPALIRLYADREREGTQRRFYVSDNGAGFDMRYVARLFQPFQRLHRPDEFPGIGIGLAAAQRIIRRHGGEIRGWSEPGRGAKFAFTLPQPESGEPQAPKRVSPHCEEPG